MPLGGFRDADRDDTVPFVACGRDKSRASRAICLVCHDRQRLSALIAALAVTALVFAVARPAPDAGIVTPALFWQSVPP